MYKKLIRPLLFRLEAETAHNLIKAVLKVAERSWPVREILAEASVFEHPSLEVNLWGMTFKNPVGVAAGFDKDAEVVLAMSSLGFGFVEVGGVTYLPQPGNPKPRAFRLVEDRAFINRMGMNSLGAVRVAANLEGSLGERAVPVGVNIASSTGAKDPIRDWIATMKLVYPLANYLVVNVSCPNVEGHRSQQEREFFADLTYEITKVREALLKTEGYRPILPKISPELTWAEIDDILGVTQAGELDGVIATNTTLQRQGLTSPLRDEVGGLSGEPLRARSTEIIAYIHRQLPQLPIIGVGGIFTAQDAWEKLRAGASLIQLFTALIYEGPLVVRNINAGLMELLERSNLESITDIIGAEV